MFRFLAPLSVLVWGQSALAEGPRVVTDIAPVQSLVAMVMGDLGQPGLMLPQGADPHDFQLRPSQAQDLAAAEIVFWVGPEMTPWMGRALDGLGLGTGFALLDAPETLTRAFTEMTEDKGEAAEHDHAPHAHMHDGLDPHAWLEPENARIWLGLIAEALAAADPAQAAIYRANAVAGQAKVTEVEAKVQALLDPVKMRPFAVMHDAYGYLADHFGLQIVGSLRKGDAAMPGAAHIAALQQTLQDTQAVCIFPEANHNAASAEQMAQATGARLGGPLDPAGTMLPAGDALYGALMLGLAKTLADCLSAQ